MPLSGAGWGRGHLLEGVEQPEVSGRAHRAPRPSQPGLVTPAGTVDEVFGNRPADQVGRQRGQGVPVALPEHLGVAGDPQHRGQLPQLIQNPCIAGQPEIVPGGL